MPPIAGEDPPRDLDRDGLYRDVLGDGQVDIFDTQALFEGLTAGWVTVPVFIS